MEKMANDTKGFGWLVLYPDTFELILPLILPDYKGTEGLSPILGTQALRVDLNPPNK